MCGLVGIAGDTTGSWKDVFNELLIIDVVRGPHSTGAGFVGRSNDEFMLAKRLGDPFNLLRSEPYDNAMDIKHSQRVMIGHNRSATIGDKTEANAHPFMFENVIGAHNGTLDKFCIKDLVDHHKFGTDSEAIFATINAKSIDDALKQMSGAWALTYYDKRDKTLNMIRNDRRPLHYAYSADRTTIIWASEPEMIEYVIARRKKFLAKDEHGKNQIFSIPPNKLYTWTIPVSISGKIETPNMRPIEGRTWVSTHAAPFHGGTTMGAKKNKKGGTAASTFSLVPFDNRADSKKFRHPYRDRYGCIISKKQFESMVDEGCAFCNANGQHFGQFIKILGSYTGYHTPYMCEDCYNSEEQYQIAQYVI